MKKGLLVLIAIALIFTMTACGNKNIEIEGTLEELIEKIYAGSDVDFSTLMTGKTEIDADNIEYFLGTADIDYKEALASEAMIMSIAHSMVLLRANDGADIDKIKKSIKDNVDGRKWICVGVEDKDIVVDNIGNLVILIMDNDSKALHDSFKKLAE